MHIPDNSHTPTPESAARQLTSFIYAESAYSQLATTNAMPHGSHVAWHAAQARRRLDQLMLHPLFLLDVEDQLDHIVGQLAPACVVDERGVDGARHVARLVERSTRPAIFLRLP